MVDSIYNDRFVLLQRLNEIPWQLNDPDKELDRVSDTQLSRCSLIAKYGDLTMMKYALEEGSPLGSLTYKIAIYHGKLSIIQYFDEQGYQRPDDSMYLACISDHLDIIQYLYDSGVSLTDEHIRCIVTRGNDNVISYIHKIGAKFKYLDYYIMITTKKFELVKEIFEHGHHENDMWISAEDLCWISAILGCVDLLKFFHEHGCPITERCYYFPGIFGMDTNSGFSYDIEYYPLWNSIYNGNTELYCSNLKDVYQYLNIQIPWNKRIFSNLFRTCKTYNMYTPKFRKLFCDLLQYLHQHNAPCDENWINISIDLKIFELIQYLLKNKCPVSLTTYNKACKNYLMTGDKAIFHLIDTKIEFVFDKDQYSNLINDMDKISKTKYIQGKHDILMAYLNNRFMIHYQLNYQIQRDIMGYIW